MKRKKSLPTSLAKKPERDPKNSQPQPLESGESSTSNQPDGTSSVDIESNLPEVWSLQQYHYFREKYDGLGVSEKKLGCKHCKRFADLTKEKSIIGAKEWKNFQIVPGGRSREVRQASLRKKLNEHFSSRAHNICVEKLKQCEQETITKGVDRMTEKCFGSTCRVFNTVYSLAQRCRPFSDIEELIELQTINGVDLGIGLHSRKTTVAIVDCIAKDIREHLFAKIIEKNRKICLIIDEASTISSKPVLILYLKVEDPDFPPTIFLELVELEGQDAETIYCTVMESLNNVGFYQDYLEKHLIEFCCDGDSVMLGRNSGLSARIAKDFPNIIWHCLHHHLLPSSIKKGRDVIRNIVVSSVEAERGFLQMNAIRSENRNRLTVSNITNLMTINLIGLPLREWDPVPTVKKWLREHHTADDGRVRQKKTATEDDNTKSILQYFK